MKQLRATRNDYQAKLRTTDYGLRTKNYGLLKGEICRHLCGTCVMEYEFY
jgi:hypothetical protein